MSENTQPEVLESFSEIIKQSCSLANLAKVRFSMPFWQSDQSLEENLHLTLNDLNKFLEDFAIDQLDVWVFSIADQEYSSNLSLLAMTLKRILYFLSDHDPFNGNSMHQNIETPEWRFRYFNVDFFILVFAPCYPTYHPRSSHSENCSYFLFQPLASFQRLFKKLDIIGERNRGLRVSVRRDFAKRGSPLDIHLMDTDIEAYKYIKPIDIGDPPIKWWI